MTMIEEILTNVLMQGQVPIDPGLTSNYMLLGYGVMWLIALLYVASLVSRQNNLQKELELLRQLLEDNEEQTAA